MNQKAWMTTFLVLASAFAVGTASAIEPGKGYVGASVGYTNMDDSFEGSPDIEDNDFGWKVLGGYNVNQYFGAQAGYTDLGKFSSLDATWEPSGFFVDGVGYYPIQPQIDAFAKLGVFFWDADGRLGVTDASENGTDLVWGFGGRWAFNEQIGVIAEYERFDADAAVGLWSVGFDYQF